MTIIFWKSNFWRHHELVGSAHTVKNGPMDISAWVQSRTNVLSLCVLEFSSTWYSWAVR